MKSELDISKKSTVLRFKTALTFDLFNLQESIKDFAKEFLGEDYISVQDFKNLIENNEIDIQTQVELNEWEQLQNKE